MHYALKIKADLTNIKNIFIDNIVQITIKCIHCSKIHPKKVTVTSDSFRTIENQKANFFLNCTECDSLLSVKMHPITENRHLHWLDAIHKERKIVYLSTKEGENFIGCYFDTNQCEINIEDIILNVLTDDKALFEDIKVENGCWEGVDENGKSAMFVGLKFWLEEIK